MKLYKILIEILLGADIAVVDQLESLAIYTGLTARNNNGCAVTVGREA